MYCGIYDSDLYKAITNATPLPKGCDIQRIIPKKSRCSKVDIYKMS